MPGFDAMNDWAQAEMRTRVHRLAVEVFALDVHTTNVVTRQSIQLLGMLPIHKWRLRLLFNSLDVVDLFEFDWLFSFANISSRLAMDDCVHKEAELLLVEGEISELQEGDTTESVRHQKSHALQAAYTKLTHEVETLVGSTDETRLLLVQVFVMANLVVVACMADAEWYGHNILLEWLLALFPVGWSNLAI